MLIHFGVKPYLVFDGDYLPSKAHTEKERATKRKESKKLGLELLAMGRISQAHLELQKAVDVTPTMARELIEELKRLDVPYIVAPYEADSQLAYLENQGVISGVLSEDSDLLVFGVKCLLTKLDQYGDCVTVNRADFTACREISLVGWTDKDFRTMAMLSGCDYLPGIDKMGLKTAYRLVRKHKSVERIIRSVQFDGKMKVPAGYLEAFAKAENTFMYQWVFCREARCLVNLHSVPTELKTETMPYLGQQVEPEVAAAVAAGGLDPNTKERLTLRSGSYEHPASRPKPAQTPDEKQGKPISEWFKPKRTPLAELDPNSFTPSPSQQRLMQDEEGASWSASQVQALRPASSLVAAASVPSSAPQAARRTVSDQWPSMQRTSPKRQRLCSERALAASMDGNIGLQTATSRFFSKHNAQPSPSVRKTSEQRKKNKEDFELWSDDSALEAAAAMTAIPVQAAVETPSPKKRKKINVYADAHTVDASAMEEQPADPADLSQINIGSSATLGSQNDDDHETPDNSFELEGTETHESVFSKGVDAEFAALKSKHALHATSSRTAQSRTKFVNLHSTTPLQEAQQRRPLGRLADSARSPEQLEHQALREREVSGQDEHRMVPASSPVAPSTTQEERPADENIDDKESLAMQTRKASPIVGLAVHGSEDLLIPNSPDSVGDDGRSGPKLSLAKFAFSGHV